MDAVRSKRNKNPYYMGIVLTDEIRNCLNDLAIKEERTVSYLIRQLLREALAARKIRVK